MKVVDKYGNELTQNEIKKIFYSELLKHRALLFKAASKLIKLLPDKYYDVFIKNLTHHDLDKIKSPLSDYYPIIYLAKAGYLDDDKLDPYKQKYVTIKHITTQSHHPEFWSNDFDPDYHFDENNRDGSYPDKINVQAMPVYSILEMVADWWSTSIIKNNSLSQWYNFVKHRRYNFNDYQDKVILDAIDLLENKDI